MHARKAKHVANLNIVLVQPRIPQNTGNVARTCAVTGAALHIIKPMGFEIEDSKLKRAGLDYWHLLEVTYYENLEEFFRKTSGTYYFFTTKGGNTHSAVAYPDNCFLLFGREDAGLPEEVLKDHPDTCVRIPMFSKARSLNLSNTVAIAAFEVLRQWEYPDLSGQGKLRDYPGNINTPV